MKNEKSVLNFKQRQSPFLLVGALPPRTLSFSAQFTGGWISRDKHFDSLDRGRLLFSIDGTIESVIRLYTEKYRSYWSIVFLLYEYNRWFSPDDSRRSAISRGRSSGKRSSSSSDGDPALEKSPAEIFCCWKSKQVSATSVTVVGDCCMSFICSVLVITDPVSFICSTQPSKMCACSDDDDS